MFPIDDGARSLDRSPIDDEAERLLDTMCADVGRGETKPLVYAASMKEAAVARRMSLMRRVYVHESRRAFIANARSDGEVVERSRVVLCDHRQR